MRKWRHKDSNSLAKVPTASKYNQDLAQNSCSSDKLASKHEHNDTLIGKYINFPGLPSQNTTMWIA